MCAGAAGAVAFQPEQAAGLGDGERLIALRAGGPASFVGRARDAEGL